jgi:hypothetical protein
MPIGIPKVLYWIPGDEKVTWVDLCDIIEKGHFFLVKRFIHI